MRQMCGPAKRRSLRASLPSPVCQRFGGVFGNFIPPLLRSPAATVAGIAFSANAAVGDARMRPPDAPTFPRPMPGKVEAPETLGDYWQMVRDWLRPRLGLSPAAPMELQ